VQVTIQAKSSRQ